MEQISLRTLHPAPARSDLISQEQRLLWMDEHIQRLEQEKAVLLERLQAAEQHSQLTAVQIQQVIQANAALAARAEQLDQDKASLLEQIQEAAQANQALSDQLQALTQRTDALEQTLRCQPAGAFKDKAAGESNAKHKARPKESASSPTDFLPKSACGQSCFWTLDGGLLTIHGSGKMTDYAVASSVPWSKHRSGITAVVLSEGITSVGGMAFSYCDKLRNVRLPSTITYIGKSAFWRCTSLSEITLPDSLTAIGRSAFWRCTSLSNIQFPAGLSTLDSNAFFGCSSLSWISFLGGAPRFIGQRVFDEVNATVHYPGNNSSWNMGIQSRGGGKLTWKPTSR